MPHKAIHRRIVQREDHWFLEETQQAHALRMKRLEDVVSFMLKMQTVSGHQHDTTHTESAHVVVEVVPLHGRMQERHYLAEWCGGREVSRLPDG